VAAAVGASTDPPFDPLFAVETASFTSLPFFLGDFGFAMMGYSLHAPRFKNDWIC